MFYLTLVLLCFLGLGLLILVIQGKFPLNGYPFLMMIPVFGFFVINALQLYANHIAFNYLDEWMFTFTTLVVLLSFGAALAGWLYVDILPSSRKNTPSFNICYPIDRLFTIGSICHILSFIAELIIATKAGGIISLYSVGHSFYGGADSDYIYLVFYLTFIGAVPYLQCLICGKNLPYWQRSVILIVLALQVVRAFLVGQRGWMLNLLFIYTSVPFFCKQQRPSLRQVIPFALPALLIVIILPAIRGNIYIGSKNLDQLPQQLEKGLQQFGQGSSGSGIYDEDDPSRVASEYILGSAIISTAWSRDQYTYGTSFYEVLVSPIPRQIWPEKPKDIGLKSWVELIHNNFPWSFNPGSYPTGIADVFLNLGFGCILFWFGFGRVNRWAYDQASIPGNFYGQSLYVSLLLGSVFLLTQGIYFWGTNLITCLIFMTVLYTYARIIPQPQSI